jgi:hypothetical protein
VVVVSGDGGAAATVEVKWKVNVHGTLIFH